MALLYVLFFIYALFLGPFVRAFVLKTLWGWFMVPLFGLPSMGMAAAFGVGLVLHTFVGGSTPPSKLPGETPSESKSRGVQLMVNVLLTPILTLIIGAIAHAFMT